MMRSLRAAIVCLSFLTLAPALVRPSAARADSAPVLRDPLIQALCDSVSATRLYNQCVAMSGFFTRHTWSDSTQATTGIGAARRWAKAQFDTISAHSGGSLTTSYFDWYQFGSRWSRNVMAVQPAAGPHANQVVAIGGHLDSRTVFINDATSSQPGANDDATGTGTAIECARLMAPHAWERTVQYHHFTGEEQGLLGSKAYAAHAESIGLDLRGYITLDIVGASEDAAGTVDTTRVRTFADTTALSRSMQRYMKRIGEAYVPGFQVVVKPKPDRTGRGSDHLGFSDHGFTAIRLIEMKENLTRQHNSNDLLGYLRPAYHAKVTRVALACLANLAQAPATPANVSVVPTPNGHWRVSWDANGEGDLAGYLVGVRGRDPVAAVDDSSIVGGDAYTMVDVGLVTQHILAQGTPGDSVYIVVAARDTGGHESIPSREQGRVMLQATDVPAGTTPAASGVTLFGLGEPRPNPASGHVEVSMSSSAGRVAGTLAVYDIEGRRVRTLHAGELPAGAHPFAWDLRDAEGARVPAGVFFIRLDAAGETISRKLVVAP